MIASRHAAATCLAAVALVTAVASAPAGAAVPTWTVASSSPPTFSQYAGLACPSVTTCLAVGRASGGIAAIRGTSDGGATWATLVTEPASVALSAVACESTSSCMVAGSTSGGAPFGEWTADGGATWTIRALPRTMTAPSAVVCETTTCEVASPLLGGGIAVAWTTTQGASWTRHAFSTPDTSVDGLACVNPSLCLISTSGFDLVSGNPLPSVMRKTTTMGRTWTTVTLPASVASVSSLGCGGARLCAITSNSAHDGRGRVLTTADRGATWHQVFASRAYALDAVSCPSPSSCAVVGTTTGLQRGVALHTLNAGHTWSVHGFASSAVQYPLVACASATTCLASSWSLLLGAPALFGSTDGGAVWQAQDVQAPVTVIHEVVCPVVGTCEAIAYSSTGAMAERSADGGATWTPQALPAGARYAYGLTCPTVSTCLVSSYLSGVGFAETTNGGATWSSPASPVTFSIVASMTCASALVCVVAGDDSSYNPTEVWTADGGTTWAVGTLPASALNSFGSFSAISCPTTTMCEAGLSTLSGPEILNSADGGRTWTVQLALGGNFFGDNFTGMTCATATTCMVVGYTSFSDQTGTIVSDATFIYRTTNGGLSWGPVFAIGARVSPILAPACRPDGWCETVGTDISTSRSIAFNSTDGGATWTSQVMPAGWVGSTSLSCPADNACWSAGVTSSGGWGIAQLQ